jgi:hypothetical protein
MTGELRSEVYDFLYSTFPGSTLDDGYYFVHVKAPVSRRVRRVSATDVLTRLVDEPSWLVTVNADPTGFVGAARFEKGSTTYNPDWNISEEMPQWIAALPANPVVDLDGLRKSMKPLGALALISPSHRLIFDVRYMLVHAASNADLDALVKGNEQSFEREEHLGS